MVGKLAGSNEVKFPQRLIMAHLSVLELGGREGGEGEL